MIKDILKSKIDEEDAVKNCIFESMDFTYDIISKVADEIRNLTGLITFIKSVKDENSNDYRIIISINDSLMTIRFNGNHHEEKPVAYINNDFKLGIIIYSQGKNKDRYYYEKSYLKISKWILDRYDQVYKEYKNNRRIVPRRIPKDGIRKNDIAIMVRFLNSLIKVNTYMDLPCEYKHLLTRSEYSQLFREKK